MSRRRRCKKCDDPVPVLLTACVAYIWGLAIGYLLGVP